MAKSRRPDSLTQPCARRSSSRSSPRSPALPGIGPRFGKLIEKVAGPQVRRPAVAPADRPSSTGATRPKIAEAEAGRDRHPDGHGRRAPGAAQPAPALSRPLQRRHRPPLPGLLPRPRRLPEASSCRSARSRVVSGTDRDLPAASVQMTPSRPCRARSRSATRSCAGRAGLSA